MTMKRQTALKVFGFAQFLLFAPAILAVVNGYVPGWRIWVPFVFGGMLGLFFEINFQESVWAWKLRSLMEIKSARRTMIALMFYAVGWLCFLTGTIISAINLMDGQ